MYLCTRNDIGDVSRANYLSALKILYSGYNLATQMNEANKNSCDTGCYRNKFKFRTHRNYFGLVRIGALVQMVRMPACHAGGHEFESRTHRFKYSENSIRDF